MGHNYGFEQLALTVANLDRERLIHKIKNYHGSIVLDFTDDYLYSASLERLRHILMSALLLKHKKHTRKIFAATA